MELGRRIGVENFYKYLNLYGFTEKAGIDLQGESKGIVMSQKNCGPVDLATQSFGQTSAYTPNSACNGFYCCHKWWNTSTALYTKRNS